MVVLTYSVLVGVEAARVKARISPTHTNRMRRSNRLRRKIISEVNVVRPEIRASERRVLRHWKARRSRSSQSSVEIRSNGEYTREHIITQTSIVCVCKIEPDLNVVLSRGVDVNISVEILDPRLVRSTDEMEGASAGDVQLLAVVSRGNEDMASGCCVAQRVDGFLDGGKVCSWIILGYEESALGTSFCSTLCLPLTFLVCVDRSLGGCSRSGKESRGNDCRLDNEALHVEVRDTWSKPRYYGLPAAI